MERLEPRLRPALWLAALAAIALAVAPVARGDAPTIEDYTGLWIYADGDEGRERVDDAVDHAIEPLPFFAEPIAEDRVEARLGPFERVQFWYDGARLTYTADDWGPVTAPLGGEPASIQGPTGSDLQLSQRLENGRLIQVFDHDDARRVNRYVLSGDRSVLWMRVELTSSELPRDASYRLRYRRGE